jgi:hypothetical protein
MAEFGDEPSKNLSTIRWDYSNRMSGGNFIVRRLLTRCPVEVAINTDDMLLSIAVLMSTAIEFVTRDVQFSSPVSYCRKKVIRENLTQRYCDTTIQTMCS